MAVVVATGEEGAPLVASLGDRCEWSLRPGRVVLGDFKGRRWGVVETGVGAKRMRRALEALLELLPVERLLLAGVCGGIAPCLPTGRSFFPRRVRDALGNFWLETDQAAWKWAGPALSNTFTEGALVSAERLAGRLEKQRLREKNPDAQAVDLEAVEFARVAAERGIPWAVLKTVADPYDLDLPAEVHLLDRVPGLSQAVQTAIRENTRLVQRIFTLCPPTEAPPSDNLHHCE